MTTVDWNDSYHLDIPEINEQYPYRLALMNVLYTALANKSEPRRIGVVLDKLIARCWHQPAVLVRILLRLYSMR